MNHALMIKFQGVQSTYWHPAFISDDGELTADELLSGTPAFRGELERKVVSTSLTNEYVELRPC